MRQTFLTLAALTLVLSPAFTGPLTGADDDDVADIPSQDLRAGKDADKRYFLVGPLKGVKEPKDGFGLLIVMPGGPGSADFHPFVKRIYKNSVPETFLVAQPVAVKWAENQEIVWMYLK
jgi:hypothetical protein